MLIIPSWERPVIYAYVYIYIYLLKIFRIVTAYFSIIVVAFVEFDEIFVAIYYQNKNFAFYNKMYH